ncbi:type VI secretion system protein TssA [Dyella sp. M7H15-1]|uniref:type VI secretion system protein TssA n=1 Tax=Dyella sp. M7H15-1 TaxID=2501295 RepID=UPI0010050D53|nr:type VI secretion system protein TssA [Dyella sp. M7H15-1]QAU23570.1 type VI secretion system protein TssA [Dyella sp. M7H15-1]
MLTNLLKSLFGTRKPSDLARSAIARWHDWLQPISATAPVGADPNYDDNFQTVRDEVGKFADVNDALIITHAEKLLKHTAKDTRVAAYYVYGRMRRDGAEGVAEGFELLAALVDRFGDTLLPTRPESRKAAIEWLAGSTFANRLDQVQGLSGPLLERTLSAIALMTERTTEWPEPGRPDLAPLFRRFESRIELTVPGDGTTSTTSTTPAQATAPSGTPIASSHELLERARQMAKFLREQSHGYLAAWRLMRCIRWDTLDEVPPHEASGKTRLPAPRAELRSNLKRLLLQKQWPELLERVEAAFAEGVNHFWLDLQYYAFVAQEHAGHEYAAVREMAAMDCALLLQRLPGLEHLSFNDGSPFADSTTLEWIARHATVYDAGQNPDTLVDTANESENHWASLEAQALTITTQQGLDDALAWLQKLPGHDTERQRFLRQLVMARVAERADRADIAIHLLTSLDTSAQRHRLAQWEPALAFDVKQHLIRALRTRLHRKDADKATLTQKIDALLGELTAINPARAVLVHSSR